MVLNSLRSLRVEDFTVLLQRPEWFGGKYALASVDRYPFESIRPLGDPQDQDWEEARLNRYNFYRCVPTEKLVDTSRLEY